MKLEELTEEQIKIIVDRIRAVHWLRLRRLTEEGFTPKQAAEIIFKEREER